MFMYNTESVNLLSKHVGYVNQTRASSQGPPRAPAIGIGLVHISLAADQQHHLRAVRLAAAQGSFGGDGYFPSGLEQRPTISDPQAFRPKSGGWGMMDPKGETPPPSYLSGDTRQFLAACVFRVWLFGFLSEFRRHKNDVFLLGPATKQEPPNKIRWSYPWPPPPAHPPPGHLWVEVHGGHMQRGPEQPAPTVHVDPDLSQIHKSDSSRWTQVPRALGTGTSETWVNLHAHRMSTGNPGCAFFSRALFWAV